MKSKFLIAFITLILGSVILLSSYDEYGHKKYGRFSMFHASPPKTSPASKKDVEGFSRNSDNKKGTQLSEPMEEKK